MIAMSFIALLAFLPADEGEISSQKKQVFFSDDDFESTEESESLYEIVFDEDEYDEDSVAFIEDESDYQ